MPIPRFVKYIPFAGDALNFVDELSRGLNAGIDPISAAKRASALATGGAAASVLFPADVATYAPAIFRGISRTQKERIQKAKTPIEKAAVISHPNPLRKDTVLGSPESAARLAGILDYANPESWGVVFMDNQNPNLEGSYSWNPEQRAEEIKQELLRKAAKKPQ